MFNKNNGADYVTRSEGQQAIADVMSAVTALDSRVADLETLARTLRGNSASVSAPVAQRSNVAGSDVNTSVQQLRADARSEFDNLRRDGQREFDELRSVVQTLSAKIDTAVSDLVQRSQRTTQAVRQEVGVTHTDAESISRVDYGAVAFGLSQIKRDVANVIGTEVRANDLTEHYRQTVQYFADVFAKADPAFDANAFRTQAGV